MAKLLKLRRGTTTQHSSFTGAEGEVTIDTTKDTAVVHDGSQAGGRPLLREDLNNLGTGAIATAKIADDAITTDKLANSINSAITANTAKTSNATHTGEVTGATALTIADDVVDEANLKISNSPTNGYFLSAQSGNTGGLTWANVDLTALSASNLTSGTVPDARFPATLPAVSAANLTSIPAANITGTLPALDGSNLTGIAGIPSGVIAIWSGATSAIPSGWVICDGNNSTPDLRDRFVVGATAGTGDTSFPGVSPGATGGGFSGSMTVSVNGNTGWASQYSNASSNPNASPEPFNSRDRHQHGWGGNFSHSYDKTPPYYALAFIMKS